MKRALCDKSRIAVVTSATSGKVVGNLSNDTSRGSGMDEHQFAGRKQEHDAATTSASAAKLEHSDGKEESRKVDRHPDTCVAVLDSGANRHCCPHEKWFVDMQQTDVSVRLADGSVQHCRKGDVEAWLMAENGLHHLKMKDVLHMPGSAHCLLSLTELVDQGYEVLFKKEVAHIMKDGVLFAKADRRPGYRWIVNLMQRDGSMTGSHQ